MFRNKAPNPTVPGVEDITPDELWARRSEVCVVDVRGADEYQGELGRVPGARLEPLDQLTHRLDHLPRNQTIVFVCRSGGRSTHAAALALNHGLQNVYNMAGGMLRWNQLGLDVERGS